jgi:hypothetical protein
LNKLNFEKNSLHFKKIVFSNADIELHRRNFFSFLTLDMSGGNISRREQEGGCSPTVGATVLGTIKVATTTWTGNSSWNNYRGNNTDWQQFV